MARPARLVADLSLSHNPTSLAQQGSSVLLCVLLLFSRLLPAQRHRPAAAANRRRHVALYSGAALLCGRPGAGGASGLRSAVAAIPPPPLATQRQTQSWPTRDAAADNARAQFQNTLKTAIRGPKTSRRAVKRPGPSSARALLSKGGAGTDCRSFS